MHKVILSFVRNRRIRQFEAHHFLFRTTQGEVEIISEVSLDEKLTFYKLFFSGFLRSVISVTRPLIKVTFMLFS